MIVHEGHMDAFHLYSDQNVPSYRHPVLIKGNLYRATADRLLFAISCLFTEIEWDVLVFDHMSVCELDTRSHNRLTGSDVSW